MIDTFSLPTHSWKNVGESFLAMYKHQNECLVPRPDFGRRIDLSMYQDPDCLLQTPPTTAPAATHTVPATEPPLPATSAPLPELPPPPPTSSSSPSSSLPAPCEPTVQLQVQVTAPSQVPQSQSVIEISTTATVTIPAVMNGTTAAVELAAATPVPPGGQYKHKQPMCQKPVIRSDGTSDSSSGLCLNKYT